MTNLRKTGTECGYFEYHPTISDDTKDVRLYDDILKNPIPIKLLLSSPKGILYGHYRIIKHKDIIYP